jgi:hypothetical protein
VKKTPERIAEDMAAAIAAIIHHVSQESICEATVRNAYGSSAYVSVGLREGVDPSEARLNRGPLGVGLRAIRAAGLHVVDDFANDANGTHEFRVVMGTAVSGIVARIVVERELRLVTLKEDPSDPYEWTHRPYADDVHSIHMTGPLSTRLSVLMTSVGDRATIVHPDNSDWESAVLVNHSTASMRRFRP